VWDLSDLACGDALDVHLGDGELEGPLAADAALDGLGVELDAAGLGDAELKRPGAGEDGLLLEPVGVSPSRLGALVRRGSEGGLAFGEHGECARCTSRTRCDA